MSFDYMKGMFGDQAALLHHLYKGTVSDFYVSHVDESYFATEYLQVFSVLKAHITKYKTIPSLEVIKEVSPEIAELISNNTPSEPLSFYRDRAISKQKFKVTKSLLTEAVELLNKKDFDGTMSIFAKIQNEVHALDVKEFPATTSNDFWPIYKQHLGYLASNSGIYTGWPKIDQEGAFCDKGQLSAIIGRLGMGKSLCLQYIAHYNQQQGKKVLFLSCEMDAKDMVFRHTALHFKHNSRMYSLGEVATLTGQIIVKKTAESKAPPVVFIGVERQKAISADTIRAEVALHSPDIVCVDSAYLMEYKSEGRSDYYVKQGEMAKQLAFLAVELGLPIVATYQANRESAKTLKQKGGEVDSTHIAGSDEIGRIATHVIHIGDNERDDEGEYLPYKKLRVIKYRHGKDKYNVLINYDFNTMNISQAEDAEISYLKEVA